MAGSPTQRALAECRKRGWPAQVVERWNKFAGVRQDLFGCIDVLAITPDGILGIQVTSGAHHSHREEKAMLEPRLALWRQHALFQVWSYRKAKGRWQLRTSSPQIPVVSNNALIDNPDLMEIDT